MLEAECAAAIAQLEASHTEEVALLKAMHFEERSEDKLSFKTAAVVAQMLMDVSLPFSRQSFQARASTGRQ